MNALLKRTVVLSVFLAVFLVCGLSAGLAQARNLDAGTIYVEPKVGFYGNSSPRIGSMFTYGAEAGYFLADGFSMGIEALGYVITQRSHRSGGGPYETVNAFSPIAIARYHFINEQRYSVFAGAGIGGFFSGQRVPRNGYYSNLTEVAEVGANVALKDNLYLQAAARWQHIGEFTEKGADNWGGNVSLKFTF